MSYSPAIYAMTSGDTDHAYDTTSRSINSDRLRIYPHGDILVSIKLFTESKMTNLYVNGVQIPFEHIGPGFVYLVENRQLTSWLLADNIVVSDVTIVSYSCLWLFVMPEKHTIINDLLRLMGGPMVREVTYQDICQKLNIVYPQTSSSVDKTLISTLLDSTEYLPIDTTTLIADYYSPYKCDYHIERIELKEGKQEYNPINPLKVVAVRHPKDVNIDILVCNCTHILPTLDSILTIDANDNLIRCIGPCDTSFTGYDPEKDNVRYFTFKENRVEITANKPTSISLICLG